MTKKRAARRTSHSLDPRLIIVGAVLIIVALVALMFLVREDSDTYLVLDNQAATALMSGVRENSNNVPIETPVPMADAFSLPTFDGGEIALADFRGQYVLLNFWASWCPPCKAEMPDLHAYYQTYKDQGFTVLAVSTNDDPANALQFVQDNRLTFPVVLDMSASVYDLYKWHAIQQYGGDGLPTSYLIGPDGALIKVWKPGAITRADLDRDVTPLLTS